VIWGEIWGMIWGVIWGVILGGDFGGDLGVMPKVNLKKIMLSLSLYCHVFSVGM
jgi:hypothetical protein